MQTDANGCANGKDQHKCKTSPWSAVFLKRLNKGVVYGASVYHGAVAHLVTFFFSLQNVSMS